MTGDDVLSVLGHDPVERAIAECHRRLEFNVAAYGKAWTGEGDDTRFIVAPLADELRGAVCLTDAERERLLWWLHRPVPPGPMKDLDVALIAKLTTGRGQ